MDIMWDRFYVYCDESKMEESRMVFKLLQRQGFLCCWVPYLREDKSLFLTDHISRYYLALGLDGPFIEEDGKFYVGLQGTEEYIKEKKKELLERLLKNLIKRG